MTEPNPPAPDHLPDHVLEELLGAFAVEPEASAQYDFDDPSIDRLLGITDEHPQGDDEPDGDLADDAFDDAADDDDELFDDDDELFDDDLPDDDLPDDDLPAGEPDGLRDHLFDNGGEPAAALGAPQPAPEPAAAEPAAPRRTIVIAEDDRPDSVYLDEDKEKSFHARREALDESGERSTIVIADMDDSGAVEPAPSRSGGGIDPRIRARRISVRRAEGRRRLLLAGIVALVVLVAVGAIAVVASPIFDVREVAVQGAVYTDDEVLAEVIASLQGEPVLLVDTRAAEAKLESVPWVESARVQTDFPHKVLIDIRERHAVATFQGGDGRFRVIDVQGRVLDVIDNQPIAYMLITGNNPDTVRGQFAGGLYSTAASLVNSLPAEIRAVTDSVGVDSTTGTFTMLLDGPVEVRLGDAQGLDDKLARLLGQLRSGLEGVCQLDVSTVNPGVQRC